MAYTAGASLRVACGRGEAMREYLYVDVGRLVPAVTFRVQLACGAARSVELENHSIGAVLLRAAQRRVGCMVEPHVVLAVGSGDGTTHSPHAETVLHAAIHREVEAREFHLPDPQAAAEIVIERRGGAGAFGNANGGAGNCVGAFAQARGGERGEIAGGTAEVEADVLIEVAE